MSIVESVKNFIVTCPYLHELEKFGVDFLPEEKNAFSIEEIPVNTIIKEFIDGSSERQFVFVIAARLHYSDEIRNNIDNSGLFENLQQWLDDCSKNGTLPTMAEGLTPFKIEAQSNGYLFDVNGDLAKARYQIQCRLIYDKE